MTIVFPIPASWPDITLAFWSLASGSPANAGNFFAERFAYAGFYIAYAIEVRLWKNLSDLVMLSAAGPR
jgi:hypothetical protein